MNLRRPEKCPTKEIGLRTSVWISGREKDPGQHGNFDTEFWNRLVFHL